MGMPGSCTGPRSARRCPGARPRRKRTAVCFTAPHVAVDKSACVLSCVLAAPAAAFDEAVTRLSEAAEPSFALAALNSLLSGFTAAELRQAVATAPQAELSPFLANYVAAMSEMACCQCGLPAPAWTLKIEALAEPAFGSALPSLRLYLLTHSPASFRRRNIFIDSSVGAQV